MPMIYCWPKQLSLVNSQLVVFSSLLWIPSGPAVSSSLHFFKYSFTFKKLCSCFGMIFHKPLMAIYLILLLIRYTVEKYLTLSQCLFPNTSIWLCLRITLLHPHKATLCTYFNNSYQSHLLSFSFSHKGNKWQFLVSWSHANTLLFIDINTQCSDHTNQKITLPFSTYSSLVTVDVLYHIKVEIIFIMIMY